MPNPYSVRFPNQSLKNKFYKVLKDIQPESRQDQIIEVVVELAKDPRPYQTSDLRKIKSGLPVARFTAQYRIRIGDYRVLYDVDDSKEIVWILALRKRDEDTYK